jgi:heme exporter protein B
MSLWRLLLAELRLQLRHKQDWLVLLLFFVLILILVPFAVGPEPELLRRIAPGIIWLAILLLNLLGLERLLLADAQDGTLELMQLSRVPLALIMAVKLLAQTVLLLVGLGLLLPLAWLLFDFELRLLPVLALSFVLGVPVIQALGGIMAALTISLQRGLGLLTILLVPVSIPVVIFAVSATEAVTLGTSPAASLLLLAALAALAVPLAPILMAAAIQEV